MQCLFSALFELAVTGVFCEKHNVTVSVVLFNKH